MHTPIKATCEAVLQVCQALGLPDDDLLHCIATVHALNAQGIDAKWTAQSVDLTETRVWGLQFAVFTVNDIPHDMRGGPGDWEDLGRFRVDYLCSKYGLAIEPDEQIRVAADITTDEYLQMRWPGFEARCQQVAQIALARLADPSIPLPSRLEALPLHGGPMVHAHYETKASEYAEGGQYKALMALAKQWREDPDQAKAANFPQLMLRIVGVSRTKDRGAGFIPVVDLLCSMGVNDDEWRALGERGHMLTDTIAVGNDLLARHIVDAGAPLDFPCGPSNATSPLGAAILNQLPELAHYLLDKGASPNAYEFQTHAPLGFAVVRNDPRLVERLLAMGANPHLKGIRQENFLHQLVEAASKKEEKHYLQVLEMLLAAGVLPHDVNEDGISPVRAARQKGLDALEKRMINWQANLLDEQTKAIPQRPVRRTL